jgi:hypothetical protein
MSDTDLFGNPIKKEKPAPAKKLERVLPVVTTPPKKKDETWTSTPVRPYWVEKIDSTHTIIWNA